MNKRRDKHTLIINLRSMPDRRVPNTWDCSKKQEQYGKQYI